MKYAAVIVTILMILLAQCMAEESITLSVPETITGYADNTITVASSMPGLLMLEVRDENGTVYRIAEEIGIQKGKTDFVWDGLGAWDRPIEKGTYGIHATLLNEGRKVEASGTFTLTGNAQAIVFALADADTIYADGKPLELTLRLVRAGRAVIEICSAGEPMIPLATFRKNVDSTKPVVFTWDGTADGAFVHPGDYVIRAYAEENPARKIEIPVTAAQEQDEMLMLTGSIMPEGENDIWNAVCAPAVTVNIGSGSTANVYRKADSRSEVVGTVAGQTQCVEVVRTGAVWTQVSFWRQEDGAPVTGYIQTDKLKIAHVNERYGLLLDKDKQTISVFRDGVLIGTMPVSTGLAAYRKLERETPAGSYLIGGRANLLNTDDGIVRYPVLFGGNRAIYASIDAPGNKCTYGGVATSLSDGEGQIDAYWLWTQIPANTRLIILDDPAQRNLDAACAAANVVAGAETWLKTPRAMPLMENETEITLTFGGDAVIGTREKWMRNTEASRRISRVKAYRIRSAGLSSTLRTTT